MVLHLGAWLSSLKNRTIGRCRVPVYAILLSLFAATGGLMFGYDLGVSGGVTVMDDFLCTFFPEVLEEKMGREGRHHANCKFIIKNATISGEEGKSRNIKKSPYCTFGCQKVQLFTSSLYLAAMAGTCLAAYVSRRYGRKVTIVLAGIFYDVGVSLNVASGSIHHSRRFAFSLLILGRLMLGIGVGFGNQAIPLYISEIAPAYVRGSLNYLFQLNVTIGILVASIVNLMAEKIHPWGWRLSLGLAGVPALLVTMGSLFLIETPHSLVQRGYLDEAQKVLKKLRGENYDALGALQAMVVSICSTNPNLIENSFANPSLNNTHPLNCNFNNTHSYYSFIINNIPIDGNMNSNLNTQLGSKKTKQQKFNGLFARSNRPPLIIAIAVPFFQQFTGIDVAIFYSPILFKTFGSKTEVSLYSAVAIATVIVMFTLVSIILVDRLGRRTLLLEASIQMLITQVLVGLILIGTGDDDQKLVTWRVILVLVLVCAHVSAFAWSWGPLGWLISTEIFPLACHSEGQSVSVFFNMLFTFLTAHTILSMLCTMKFGIFFFFSIWDIIMGIFTYFFLPETMKMEIENMSSLWSYHWFWKRFVSLPPPPPSPSIDPSSPTCNSPHLKF